MAPSLITAILCSVLLKLTCGANHSLLHNQNIGIGETLVSESQVFELGFFHPGKSRNVFLGIWYKFTPDVVVWVANRNHPITHSQGVIFGISESGSLCISRRDGAVIWSANPPTAASRPAVIRLLDTGNLVVSTEEDHYLWQSFDFPTDTGLPGMKLNLITNLTSWRDWDDPSPGYFVMKIDNRGLPEVVTLGMGGTRKRFRSGKWNGLYFNGIPRFYGAAPRAEYIFEQGRLVSMWRPYHNSMIMRSSIDASGAIQQYMMNLRKDKWNLVFTFPRDQCDEYGNCGLNGICTVEKAQRCECFAGFAPKFPKDWDLQDWSGGCARIRPLNCESGDGFVEVKGVKHPDMLTYWLNTSMSLDDCKAECLRKCDCSACANPYITNGGSGCLMWFGDLLDTRELPAAHSTQNIYIRVPLSQLVISSNLEKGEEKREPINLILMSIATGVIVSSFINGSVVLLTKWKWRVKRYDEDIDLPTIKLATIREATNSFSQQNMIGVGGFGPVYKGSLPTGQEIAVKRLSKSSGQGLEEFKNEVLLITKLQHRNLVKLLGCCIEGEEMVLIYEYLQNKSLDTFVFDHDRRTVLSWPTRFDIIMGIAKGLLYLHHDSRFKIIHRDLKTSNILLDVSLNPKISDFGLARTFEEDQSLSRTKRVVGTYGYMAPEYAFHGKFSVKSDIYSFGVVLLEIISGKKNREFEHNDHCHSLLGHAWLLWKEKRIMEVMDECLKETFVESEVKRCIHVGLLCVQKLSEDRPIMPSVVLMLATDGATLPEPNEPGYFIEGSCNPLPSFKSPSIKSENGMVTITDLEGR
ncbi:G-type lectin S-receptor-like serine/threonine-protein kinase0 [Salvia divinorum]|uniref:Receptor-like serine/threonine-protein kinase n=1 Tax=Salvia divinorum TaxID=28513 RepID=A0ABD1IEB5_SALDI